MNSSGGAGLQQGVCQVLSLPWWGHLEAPKKGTKVAGDSPAKHKYVRLDSYDPQIGEIVSRKKTQLSVMSKEIIIQGQLN